MEKLLDSTMHSNQYIFGNIQIKMLRAGVRPFTLKQLTVSFELLPHPSYSSDLVPFDFFLFPQFKSHLCGNDNEVICAVGKFLEDKNATFFRDYNVVHRWIKWTDIKIEK